MTRPTKWIIGKSRDAKMIIVNIRQAKTHFFKLIEKVMEGEEIIIAKAGKSIAKMVSIRQSKPLRKPGALKGKIWIARDFDAPLPEDLLKLFEGK